ncbi:MAG: right-handed parallel beta-helix repeat-containing protein [Cellulosilyticaceae bacterium]
MEKQDKKKVFAKDYGINPNSAEDFTPQFLTMFREHMEDSLFILEKGEYHFYTENAIKANYYLSNTDVINPRSISILLKGMHNITLEGSGATFTCHGQLAPLAIDESCNVAIRNLTIDWEIPLSAEGKILYGDENYTDIKIDEKLYPYKVVAGHLIFMGENWEEPFTGAAEYDSKTRKIACRKGDTFSSDRQEDLGDGAIRFYGKFEPICSRENDIVLRHNKRIHPGILLNESSEVILDNITIHNTGGLGVLAQFCDTLTFNRVKFIPNTKKGRKMISGHDDGLHLSNNMGHIVIKGCYFYGLMDDPVNVHGTAVRIIECVDKRTLKGEFVHPQSLGFRNWAKKDHTISFIHRKTMETIGSCDTVSFKLMTPRTFIISFKTDMPEEIHVGDALENLTRTPSLLCEDNFFGSCRARGILLSTPKKVLIQNNIFESAGSAILIAGDANQWYESGACQDVTICHNQFADCCLSAMYQFCEGVISICPEVPQPDETKPFHRNIKIYENTFHTCGNPVLYAYSTTKIKFYNNKILRSYSYEPWHPRKNMINLAYCSAVMVEDNMIIGDIEEKLF